MTDQEAARRDIEDLRLLVKAAEARTAELVAAAKVASCEFWATYAKAKAEIERIGGQQS